MKLFEYMACGRAILSSDLPVLRETLNSEMAVLLPAEDVSAWVEAVQALQSNNAQRLALGQAARRMVEQYSLKSHRLFWMLKRKLAISSIAQPTVNND
jgi:glycosyltransferase involved in cell wall biosynthesis